jgi:hypothetical protein
MSNGTHTNNPREKISMGRGSQHRPFLSWKGEANSFLTKLTIGKNCSIFRSLSYLRLIEIFSLPLCGWLLVGDEISY